MKKVIEANQADEKGQLTFIVAWHGSSCGGFRVLFCVTFSFMWAKTESGAGQRKKRTFCKYVLFLTWVQIRFIQSGQKCKIFICQSHSWNVQFFTNCHSQAGQSIFVCDRCHSSGPNRSGNELVMKSALDRWPHGMAFWCDFWNFAQVFPVTSARLCVSCSANLMLLPHYGPVNVHCSLGTKLPFVMRISNQGVFAKRKPKMKAINSDKTFSQTWNKLWTNFLLGNVWWGLTSNRRTESRCTVAMVI